MKASKKTTLAFALAAILTLCVPFSASAATAEDVSLEASTATSEAVAIETSGVVAEIEESESPEEDGREHCQIHLSINVQKDKYGLISSEYGRYIDFGIYANETIKVNGKVVYRKNEEISTELSSLAEDVANRSKDFDTGISLYTDNSLYTSTYLPKGKYYVKVKNFYGDNYYTITNINKKYAFAVADTTGWEDNDDEYRKTYAQQIDLSANGTKVTVKPKTAAFPYEAVTYGDSGDVGLKNVKIQVQGYNHDKKRWVTVYTGSSDVNGQFAVPQIINDIDYRYRITSIPTGYKCDYTLNKWEEFYGHTDCKYVDTLWFSKLQKKSYLYGDVDLDGKITAADVTKISRAAVSKESLSAVQKILADVDGDGKVTSSDSFYVLRYSVGLKDKGTKLRQSYTYYE